jgi:hypothetical protein
MSQIGRISGPLLKDNLLRNGENLSFRNGPSDSDLLLLDVINGRVNIKNISANDFYVDDTIKTINVISTTQSSIANIRVNSNTFSTITGTITVSPNQSDPLILSDNFKIGDLDFDDNVISNYQLNGDVIFNPNSSGKTILNSSTTVNGDLTVDGNLQINGNLRKYSNIIVGDQPLDTVTVATDFSQNINPGTTSSYDLGTNSIRWANVYVNSDAQIGTLTQNSIIVSNQLQIDGTTREIYSIQSNDDAILNSDTGIQYVEDIKFQTNDITNTVTDTALTIASTGIGYVRFMENTATVFPAGTVAQRPLSPEVGDTRWNTDGGRLEIFDGTSYQPAQGGGAVIGFTEMEDLQTLIGLAVA